ncbi:unnamed protein product [Heligmosomoides polygyrus]|uniref:Ras-associating domain-containing protein n=1 Tax=Heligmosomoides polygyrus TaxID=6339 RepID=A0A3P7XN38_HELPZ|nr:unnamed protein product [Heligmosomoides polygyrus]
MFHFAWLYSTVKDKVDGRLQRTAIKSVTAPPEAVNAAITHLQDRLVHKAFFRAAQKQVKRVRHSASLDGLERMVQSLTDVRVTERPNMLKIDETITTVSKEDHQWLLKMSWCWEDVSELMESDPCQFEDNVSLRGLYLGYMKLYSSLNSIHIAVPDSLPSFLPHVHVRDDPKITFEEWQYIKTIGTDSNLVPTTSQVEFHRAISTAIHKLFDELDIDSDIMPGHRLYNAEIIAPNDDVSIILVSQYERRKCMLENDVLVYNTISERLCEFQKKLDEIWNKARWISRVASEAREKRARSSVNSTPLSRLIAPVTRMPNDNEQYEKGNQSAEVTACEQEKCKFSLSYPQQKSHGDIDRLYRRNVADTDAAMESSGSVERSQGNEEKDTTEVVRLVLQQISKTSSLPIKEVVDSGKFCLVVVVGTRERRLKDDFALSRMQSPWNKGRLYVRRRSALLAAVQYGNETHV